METEEVLTRFVEDIHQILATYQREFQAQQREIGVLTAERDNALLRIEELETELAQVGQELEACHRHLNNTHQWVDELRRGGVHPNA